MDVGTGLALKALLLGLRRSGQIGEHAMLVISDEMRLAATEARACLYDREADQIEELIVELRRGGGGAVAKPTVARRRV